MPLYEYECDACGHRFERIQKFSDPPAEECPKCLEKKVHKLVSSPAIQFKGTGWYITDYARKGGSGAEGAKADSDGKGSDSQGADGKSTDAKSGDAKSGESKSTEEKPAAKTKDEKSSPASSPAPSSSKGSS